MPSSRQDSEHGGGMDRGAKNDIMRKIRGETHKRRGGDSNPRCRDYRHNGFRDRRIQPLCHLSAKSVPPASTPFNYHCTTAHILHKCASQREASTTFFYLNYRFVLTSSTECDLKTGYFAGNLCSRCPEPGSRTETAGIRPLCLLKFYFKVTIL